MDRRGIAKKGFTLVEMIMVLVILGVIGGIGVTLVLSASEALSFLTVRSDMDQSADVAMSRILGEIRRIRDKESINNATASEFRFFDFDDSDIAYSLSSSDLMRNSDILASNLSGLTFTYYDENGAELIPPTFGIGTETDITRIKVLLSFQIGDSVFNCQSQVRPRNLE